MPTWVKFGKPTKAQLQHDAYLVVVAFLGAFLTSWQVQPDKFSKAGLIAAATAGVAAVITIAKSVLTTL